MAEKKGIAGGQLFIVDNSDKDWKVLRYLQDWSDIAHTFDIATAYFEIRALLAMDGQWQQLDKMRILMGDEVTRRTKKALLAGVESIKQTLDQSIETEKESNDFLNGVPAIVEALRTKKIECRVYFRGHEMSADEWEVKKSKIYPILATLEKRAREYLQTIRDRLAVCN